MCDIGWRRVRLGDGVLVLERGEQRDHRARVVAYNDLSAYRSTTPGNAQVHAIAIALRHLLPTIAPLDGPRAELPPRFGFSVVGAVFLVALFAPDLAWTRARPSGYDPAGENRLLRVCARVGQGDGNVRARGDLSEETLYISHVGVEDSL